MISSGSSGNLSAMGSGTGLEIPELKTGHPTTNLSVIYGVTLACQLVLVVVVVVITIVYKRRRIDARTYYTTVGKTLNVLQRNNSRRGSVRSNAAIIDLQQEQIRRSREDGGYSMELVITQEQEEREGLESYPLASTHVTAMRTSGEEGGDVVECSVFQQNTTGGESEMTEEGGEQLERGGASIYGDIDEESAPQRKERERQSSQRFSFEDGSVLQDYPASVDLEVAGNYNEGDTQKAKIMGYCDIYNSQILQTVPTAEETSQEQGDSYLKPNALLGSRKHVRVSLQKSESPIHSPTIETREVSGLVVPKLVVEGEAENDDIISEPLDHSRSPEHHKVSHDYEEAQEYLNRSLTDLLAMTEAMSVEESSEQTMNEGVPLAEGNDCISEHRPVTRQLASLPSVLDSPGNRNSPASLSHLSHSQDTPTVSPLHVGLSLSLQASRSSDINMMEFIAPNDLADLDPDIQRTLFGDQGLEITHV